jgi:hypothetical protein
MVNISRTVIALLAPGVVIPFAGAPGTAAPKNP